MPRLTRIADELQRVTRENMRRNPALPESGKRAVEADKSATVLQYARTLKGVSIDELSARTNIPVSTLQRMENGGKSILPILDSEKAALKKALGRNADDLLRPLTDANKSSYLHGLPMKEGRE
jgi:ribosome-binding protein aMBF1 (putative translation factor)